MLKVTPNSDSEIITTNSEVLSSSVPSTVGSSSKRKKENNQQNILVNVSGALQKEADDPLSRLWESSRQGHCLENEQKDTSSEISFDELVKQVEDLTKEDQPKVNLTEIESEEKGNCDTETSEATLSVTKINFIIEAKETKEELFQGKEHVDLEKQVDDLAKESMSKENLPVKESCKTVDETEMEDIEEVRQEEEQTNVELRNQDLSKFENVMPVVVDIRQSSIADKGSKEVATQKELADVDASIKEAERTQTVGESSDTSMLDDAVKHQESELPVTKKDDKDAADGEKNRFVKEDLEGNSNADLIDKAFVTDSFKDSMAALLELQKEVSRIDCIAKNGNSGESEGNMIREDNNIFETTEQSDSDPSSDNIEEVVKIVEIKEPKECKLDSDNALNNPEKEEIAKMEADFSNKDKLAETEVATNKKDQLENKDFSGDAALKAAKREDLDKMGEGTSEIKGLSNQEVYGVAKIEIAIDDTEEIISETQEGYSESGDQDKLESTNVKPTETFYAMINKTEEKSVTAENTEQVDDNDTNKKDEEPKPSKVKTANESTIKEQNIEEDDLPLSTLQHKLGTKHSKETLEGMSDQNTSLGKFQDPTDKNLGVDTQTIEDSVLNIKEAFVDTTAIEFNVILENTVDEENDISPLQENLHPEEKQEHLIIREDPIYKAKKNAPSLSSSKKGRDLKGKSTGIHLKAIGKKHCENITSKELFVRLEKLDPRKIDILLKEKKNVGTHKSGECASSDALRRSERRSRTRGKAMNRSDDSNKNKKQSLWSEPGIVDEPKAGQSRAEVSASFPVDVKGPPEKDETKQPLDDMSLKQKSKPQKQTLETKPEVCEQLNIEKCIEGSTTSDHVSISLTVNVKDEIHVKHFPDVDQIGRTEKTLDSCNVEQKNPEHEVSSMSDHKVTTVTEKEPTDDTMAQMNVAAVIVADVAPKSKDSSKEPALTDDNLVCKITVLGEKEVKDSLSEQSLCKHSQLMDTCFGIDQDSLNFFCEVCSLGFTCARRYWNHRNFLHSDHDFDCIFCEKKFKRTSALLHHSKFRHKDITDFSSEQEQGKPIFFCEACGKGFRNIQARVQHIQEEHKDGYILCSTCNSPFSNLDDLVYHAKQHLNYKSTLFSCKVCSQNVFFLHMFVNHLNGHFNVSSPKKFYCKICVIKIQGFKQFVDHMEEHVFKTPRYYCFLCKRVYLSNKKLDLHVEQFHGKQHESHKKFLQLNDSEVKEGKLCYWCGKTVAKNLFKKHAIKHKKVAMFTTRKLSVTCKVCLKSVCKQVFRKHLQKHQKVAKKLRVTKKKMLPEKPGLKTKGEGNKPEMKYLYIPLAKGDIQVTTDKKMKDEVTDTVENQATLDQDKLKFKETITSVGNEKSQTISLPKSVLQPERTDNECIHIDKTKTVLPEMLLDSKYLLGSEEKTAPKVLHSKEKLPQTTLESAEKPSQKPLDFKEKPTQKSLDSENKGTQKALDSKEKRSQKSLESEKKPSKEDKFSKTDSQKEGTESKTQDTFKKPNIPPVKKLELTKNTSLANLTNQIATETKMSSESEIAKANLKKYKIPMISHTKPTDEPKKSDEAKSNTSTSQSEQGCAKVQPKVATKGDMGGKETTSSASTIKTRVSRFDSKPANQTLSSQKSQSKSTASKHEENIVGSKEGSESDKAKRTSRFSSASPSTSVNVSQNKNVSHSFPTPRIPPGPHFPRMAPTRSQFFQRGPQPVPPPGTSFPQFPAGPNIRPQNRGNFPRGPISNVNVNYIAPNMPQIDPIAYNHPDLQQAVGEFTQALALHNQSGMGQQNPQQQQFSQASLMVQYNQKVSMFGPAFANQVCNPYANPNQFGYGNQSAGIYQQYAHPSNYNPQYAQWQGQPGNYQGQNFIQQASLRGPAPHFGPVPPRQNFIQAQPTQIVKEPVLKDRGTQCTGCKKDFPNGQVLSVHNLFCVKQTISSSSNSCPICTNTFVSIASLKQHMFLHHAQIFKEFNLILGHDKNLEKHTCKTCKQEFKTSYDLNAHEKTHAFISSLKSDIHKTQKRPGPAVSTKPTPYVASASKAYKTPLPVPKPQTLVAPVSKSSRPTYAPQSPKISTTKLTVPTTKKSRFDCVPPLPKGSPPTPDLKRQGTTTLVKQKLAELAQSNQDSELEHCQFLGDITSPTFKKNLEMQKKKLKINLLYFQKKKLEEEKQARGLEMLKAENELKKINDELLRSQEAALQAEKRRKIETIDLTEALSRKAPAKQTASRRVLSSSPSTSFSSNSSPERPTQKQTLGKGMPKKVLKKTTHSLPKNKDIGGGRRRYIERSVSPVIKGKKVTSVSRDKERDRRPRESKDNPSRSSDNIRKYHTRSRSRSPRAKRRSGSTSRDRSSKSEAGKSHDSRSTSSPSARNPKHIPKPNKEPGAYRCHKCATLFTNYRDYITHKDLHEDTDEDEENYLTLMDAPPPPQIDCLDVSGTQQQQAEFSTSFLQDYDDRWVCKVCSQVFPNQEYLDYHACPGPF